MANNVYDDHVGYAPPRRIYETVSSHSKKAKRKNTRQKIICKQNSKTMKKKLTLALFGFLLISYSSFGQHRQNMMTLDERVNLSEIIIEGEVIEKESYFDHSDNEIYTINRIKIYKQFKGNYVPDEISLVTAGGQVGDTIERVFHSFQVSLGTKGVFFFKQSRINHPLKQFPTKTQEVVTQQGFIRYYQLDNEKHLVAGSAY